MLKNIDRLNKLLEDTNLEDKRFLIISIINTLRGDNNIEVFLKTGWKHKQVLEIISKDIHIEIGKAN